MTSRHEAIREILKESPSLGDGRHDEELMILLRERWSPPGRETDNTYALKHAVWARGTLAIVTCIREALRRSPAQPKDMRELRRRLVSATKDADNGNRSRLETLRDDVLRGLTGEKPEPAHRRAAGR